MNFDLQKCRVASLEETDEPTRFRAPAGPRVHGTGGFDVRIPIEWSVFGLFDDDNTFRVGGAIDVTARYFGWGVSAGIWR